jgi:hypothetical protein
MGAMGVGVGTIWTRAVNNRESLTLVACDFFWGCAVVAGSGSCGLVGCEATFAGVCGVGSVEELTLGGACIC